MIAHPRRAQADEVNVHPASEDCLLLLLDGLDVELRVMTAAERSGASEDVLGGAGPWVGETTEEILQVMQEFRRDDGREPPLL